MGYYGGNNPYSNSGLNDGGYQYGYGQGNNNPWQQGQNQGGGNSGALWGTGANGTYSGAGGYGNGAWGAYGGNSPDGGTYGYRNQQGGWTGVYNMPGGGNSGPPGNTRGPGWTWSNPSTGQYGSPTTKVVNQVPNTNIKARNKPGEPAPGGGVVPPVTPPAGGGTTPPGGNNPPNTNIKPRGGGGGGGGGVTTPTSGYGNTWGGATTYGTQGTGGYSNGMWYDPNRQTTPGMWTWGMDPKLNPANGGGPGPGY